MRLTFRLCIFAAVLLPPSIAAADDSGWYLDGSLGLSHASEAPLVARSAREADFTHYTSSSGDQDSTGLGLGGGYWFGPNGGLQAEYVDLGQYTHLARGRTFLDCQLCGSFGFVESAKAKLSGLRLAVTPRYALSADVELVGRLGILVNQVTYYDVSNFGVPSFQKYPQKRIQRGS